MAEPVVNGLDDIDIKTEPTDPLLDVNEPPVIPKEYVLSNGLHEDSDCDDITYFTQVEVDNTRKCLENTKLIIKDFETQLDWHLQQYMALRNVVHPKKNGGKDDTSKRQDLLSISQLSALIANHPEGNKKFIKRKGPISNGAGGRKRRKNRDESEEETDYSDEDSEDFDEEDFEMGEDSEGVDDPDEGKKPKKSKAKKLKTQIQVKDEIEEEVHELIEPKMERESDEEMMEEPMMVEPEPVKKTPAKRGRKPKAEDTKVTPKKGARGKKGQKNMETVDLTNLKTCKVVLNRVEGEDDDVEIKDESIDKDELIELLKRKAITLLSDFAVDSDKPIVILKDDNVKEFDFNECKTSNVVVTFEDSVSFPEFIFVKEVAENILNGSVKLVQGSVFDEHLSDEKN